VYLDGVSEALEGSPARALAVGLAGQVLLLPALITVSVLLAVTLVGVLAIPLAVVAFVLAAAGLVTLGFLAAAFVTGRSLGGMRGPWRATAERAGAVRALVLGLSALLALWLAAALLTTLPSAALVVRAVALAVTWVAGTAGFGAALLSRAGTRGLRPTPAARAAVGTMPVDRGGVPVWQTPTPLTGIVAARRPTPVPPRVE
jgi:signal transduction histidine kinase